MFPLAFHVHVFPTTGSLFPKYLQCGGPEPYVDPCGSLGAGASLTAHIPREAPRPLEGSPASL